MKTPEERAAYYKGKYEALKEKISDTSSMIKQSIIDHTVRYVLIALFVVGGAFTGYYYVSHKVTETVTEIKQDVKDSIPHPVEATKEWFKKDHWWNKKETNETSEPIVIHKTEQKKVSQDENETSWKEKIKSLKFWGKKNDEGSK
jgi:hypothetical protein